jgi:hypothetical protein
LRAALGLPSPSSPTVGRELGRERWALVRIAKLDIAICDIKIASAV